MKIKQIFDPKLAQYSYLIGSDENGEAMLIDPLRDSWSYDALAGQFDWKIKRVAETHIHADFCSGVREFSRRDGVEVHAFKSMDPEWRYTWLEEDEVQAYWHEDGDIISFGEVRITVRHTPGHSPEHVSYLIAGSEIDPPEAILSGDFIFVGDVGRPDLMGTTGGNADDMDRAARTIFTSLERFKELPGVTRVYPGHGAGSACGKSMSPFPSSTVAQELQQNMALRLSSDEERFVDYILDGQPEPPSYFGRMRLWNRQGPPVLNAPPQPVELQVEEIGSLDKDRTIILDTRSWYDFHHGHLPGALFAPLDSQFSMLAGSYIDPDLDICLVARPERVSEAVNDLVRVGLDRIVSFVDPQTIQSYADQDGSLESTASIPVSELMSKLDADEVNVLDVRRTEELIDLGKVPTAANRAHMSLSEGLEDIPGDKPLAVYCRSGVRSTYATAFLQSQGFDVMNVEGGFLAWMAGGFPVEPY